MRVRGFKMINKAVESTNIDMLILWFQFSQNSLQKCHQQSAPIHGKTHESRKVAHALCIGRIHLGKYTFGSEPVIANVMTLDLFD